MIEVLLYRHTIIPVEIEIFLTILSFFFLVMVFSCLKWLLMNELVLSKTTTVVGLYVSLHEILYHFYVHRPRPLH